MAYTTPATKKNDYLAFDALSLRQLIIDRLNEQQVFTDQNYIGSNLASIIDIIAYSYSTLIYYLNRTSSESLFSEAQLYENINRIVKLLDYKPIGNQTATLSPSFSATSNLPVGNYTIPRYSYIVANNIHYSFNNDTSFVKQVNGNQLLTDITSKTLLYEGTYVEYPALNALGEDNETFLITRNDVIDFFNIDVYVKSVATGTYRQYLRTSNLYYENSNAAVYEVRLNENKQIEIKFGDNINGAKLSPGDVVQIYYLASTGAAGEVGAYAYNSIPVNVFNTPTFNTLYSNIQKLQINALGFSQGRDIVVTNPQSSTTFSIEENVDSIRKNAPKSFRSSNRLVTLDDFVTYVSTRFGNIVADIQAFNNWSYLSGYLRYYYNLGLTQPDLITRPQFNQILFADSCNFNNIYLTIVPKAKVSNVNYISPNLKQTIIDSVKDKALATAELVFVDPVYKAFSFGIPNANNEIDILNADLCQLFIVRDTAASVVDSYIKNNVINAIKNFFSVSNNKLGETVDLNKLLNNITAVNGVKSIYIKRTDTGQRFDGLSFFVWNPEYSDLDKAVVYNSYKLDDFQFPYFYNIDNLQNLVTVETTNINYQTLEY